MVPREEGKADGGACKCIVDTHIVYCRPGGIRMYFLHSKTVLGEEATSVWV